MHHHTIIRPVQQMTRLLLACALGLVFAPAPAFADGRFAQPPAEVSPYRQGRSWFLSGDMGFTVLSYSDNGDSAGENGLYVAVRFGGMLSPRLALSAEYWSDGHGYDGFEAASATQNTLALAGTYWIMPRLWLAGGLGTSTLKGFVDGNVQWQEEGVSAMFGVGYEIFSRPRWSVEVASRVVTSWYQPFHRTATTFGVGASWH